MVAPVTTLSPTTTATMTPSKSSSTLPIPSASPASPTLVSTPLSVHSGSLPDLEVFSSGPSTCPIACQPSPTPMSSHSPLPSPSFPFTSPTENGLPSTNLALTNTAVSANKQ